MNQSVSRIPTIPKDDSTLYMDRLESLRVCFRRSFHSPILEPYWNDSALGSTSQLVLSPRGDPEKTVMLINQCSRGQSPLLHSRTQESALSQAPLFTIYPSESWNPFSAAILSPASSFTTETSPDTSARTTRFNYYPCAGVRPTNKT